MMAYTVSRQTKEIAVRMVGGAGRWQVLGVVLRLGAQLVVAGAAAWPAGELCHQPVDCESIVEHVPGRSADQSRRCDGRDRRRGTCCLLHPRSTRDDGRSDGGVAARLGGGN